MKELIKQGFCMLETVEYYDNRPYPYTEIWVKEEEALAVMIDFGICQQPACGATWSFRMYAEKQNALQTDYKCLRYTGKDLEGLSLDLAQIEIVQVKDSKKVFVEPRKRHPQLMGEAGYESHLRAQRRLALQGVFEEIAIVL